jgi:ferritin-like metal-binding protein YciE
MATMISEKKKEIVTKYLADMIGVEGHIYQAVDKQVKETMDEPDLNPQLMRTRDILERHTQNLRSRLEALGGKPTSPLKEAGASVLGVAAGVIDKIRSEELSKDLRDDYTALNLSTISYVMLITTSLACGDRETAELCKANLKENAQLVKDLGSLVPYAVVRDLSDLTNLDPSAVQEGKAIYIEAWQ